jgi:hypothetical protein
MLRCREPKVGWGGCVRCIAASEVAVSVAAAGRDRIRGLAEGAVGWGMRYEGWGLGASGRHVGCLESKTGKRAAGAGVAEVERAGVMMIRDRRRGAGYPHCWADNLMASKLH